MAKKKAVKKKSNRKLIDKPYNSGTMSVSAFWNFIRQTLRRRTLVWKPIQNVRKAAKRPYVGDNKRRKVSYECSECHLLFSSEEIAVHHKKNVGSLTCGDDLKGFVERLFCSEEDLCVLCDKCHKNLHDKEHLEMSKI